MEILTLKNAITKMKYLLDGSNNNLDTTEENTSDLENKSIENTN